jgi:hypothetical protein
MECTLIFCYIIGYEKLDKADKQASGTAGAGTSVLPHRDPGTLHRLRDG